ncbi:MAG: antibiotic biosynthesis monooxygenase [Nitriliruptorales bacterium]
MHALMGASQIDPGRASEAEALLNDRFVPLVKQMPGFISGTWARSADGTQARSMILFESEEEAKAAAKLVANGPPPGAPVIFLSVDVLEVVAQA